jgi:hypothetical protein
MHPQLECLLGTTAAVPQTAQTLPKATLSTLQAATAYGKPQNG